MRNLLIVGILVAPLSAQGTYIVDASSGPGTNFTDIQAAVIAVPDGSTLVVRPGIYSAVDIDGKGLTILCDSNVHAGPLAPGAFLTIRNTLAQQIVTVRGLRGQGWPGQGSFSGLVVHSALGPVTYDGVGHSIATPWGYPTPAVQVIASSQVAIIDLTAVASSHSLSTCEVTTSSVVCERCSFFGRDGGFIPATIYPGRPGMRVLGSRVQLVHSNVTGGDGGMAFWKWSSFLSAGSSAIEMSPGSSLRVMGLPAHYLRGGTWNGGAVARRPAIDGNGVARVDPLVTISTPFAGAAIAFSQPTMPSVVSTTAGLLGTLTATRYGAPNLLCAMLISLRAPSTTVPWLQDPIWVDGQNFVVEAVGVTPTSGLFLVQKSVPAQTGLLGFHFLWQAVDLDQTGILAISNPSPSLVR